MFKRKKRSYDDTPENDELLSEEIASYEETEDDLFDDFPDKPEQKEKRKDFYVKKEDLIAEIKKYQESKKFNAKGIISEALGIMIMKICTRFSLHPRFYRL